MNYPRTFFAMALSFALVSSLALAQEAKPAETKAAAAGAQFAVAGQKAENFENIKTFKIGLDQQLNKPVEGILFTTAENDPSGFVTLKNAKLVLLDSAGNVVGREAVTDESGKFSFGVIKSGTFSILAEAIFENGKHAFGVVRLNTENAKEDDDNGYILNSPSELKLLLTDDLYYFDKSANLVEGEKKVEPKKVVKPENSVDTSASCAPAGGGGSLGGGGGFGALLGLGGLAGLAGLAGIGNGSCHPVSAGAACCK